MTVVTNVVGVASRNTSVTPMLLKCAIFIEAAFSGVLLIFRINRIASMYNIMQDVKILRSIVYVIIPKIGYTLSNGRTNVPAMFFSNRFQVMKETT